MHHLLTSVHLKAGQFMTENASTILTAGGVVGTVTTAVLTGKASYRASEIIHEQELEILAEAPEAEVHLSKTDKVKLVWPLFIPPVLIGTATVGSIVAANMVSAKRAAALAAAYGISENKLKEYKEKVLEKVGPNKERAVRDELAQDYVNDNPPSKEVIILAGGDVLCLDRMTGRYFRSTVENLKKAENAVNQELFNHQYASLSFFYDEVGLPPTSFSDDVGWNMAQTGVLELQFSTVMSPDEQPCVAVDFTNPPKNDYTQLY